MKDKRVIEDWVDGEEIRSLAEKLLTPPPEPAGSEDEAAYGPDFEGFAGPPAEEGPGRGKEEAPEPRSIPWSDSPAEGDAEEEKTTQPNPFHQKRKEGIPRSPKDPHEPDYEEGATASPFRVTRRAARSSREGSEGPEKPGQPGETELVEFLDWLREQIPLEACLVGRRRSESFFDDLHDERMRSVCAVLADAAHRKALKGEKAPSSLVVKLPGQRILQVIPLADACYVGLVLPRPLADSGVQALVKAFQRVFR